MWQRVEARSIKSGESRYVEINCFPVSDILEYGRIWFPETHYKNHRVLPILTVRKESHAGTKR